MRMKRGGKKLKIRAFLADEASTQWRLCVGRVHLTIKFSLRKSAYIKYYFNWSIVISDMLGIQRFPKHRVESWNEKFLSYLYGVEYNKLLQAFWKYLFFANKTMKENTTIFCTVPIRYVLAYDGYTSVEMSWHFMHFL